MWAETYLAGFLVSVVYLVSEAEEYCDRETFEATCTSSQVILIQHATYGRMSAGRCINGEGQMNCEIDVTQMLHGVCSGRQNCQLEVGDIRKQREPCKKDYASYLEAVYTCEEVATGNPSQCTHNHQIVLTSSSGLLPSLVHSNTVGIRRCPWTIQAKQGQRVQLNISVFNMSSSKSEDGSSCHYSIMLRELDSHTWHKKDVCGYTWGQTHIFTSSKSTVQLFNAVSYTPSTSVTLAQAPSYVIHYQVIGCADVVAPGFSSIIRTGNELVLKCNRTKETWFLTCKGNAWSGQIGNCTQFSTPRAEGVTSSDIPYPQGLIAAVILGLVLGVLIGFTSLGLYVLHRRRKFQRAQSSYGQDPLPLQYETASGVKDTQYSTGVVPFYRDSGTSSTYYADGVNPQPPHYGGGASLNRTHICEPALAPPSHEPVGGAGGSGGARVSGPHNKDHHHLPQQSQALFLQSDGRRDIL